MKLNWQNRRDEYTSCMKLIEYTTLPELKLAYSMSYKDTWHQIEWDKRSDILETNTSISFRVYFQRNTTELHIFNK